MNYKKVYDSLMVSRFDQKEQRLNQKKNGDYFEVHHIVPKWLGGEGKNYQQKSHPNLVLLTAREHFLAHWLLYSEYRDRKSAMAFFSMIRKTKDQNRITSSKGFEIARTAFVETQKGNTYGKGHTKVISEEQKASQRAAMLGRFVGDLNNAKKPEARLKISLALSGVEKSLDHKQKLRVAIQSLPKIKCEWCNKENDSRNHKRWHGDNCKLK